MLMLSRLTLNSRKTSLKGISQIEFTQLLDLVDSQSTWDTHRSNEEKQIHTKLKVYYLFSFSHVYGPIQLFVFFRYDEIQAEDPTILAKRKGCCPTP